MIYKENNYAFIDSNNLHLGIRAQGWRLDFKKFRVYLREKYGVTTAYLFIGYVPEHQDIYTSLQSAGYVLIFKPTLKLQDGSVKGNCDAELVLQAMIDYNHSDQAEIVSGDGDFYCLVKYLYVKGKLKCVLIPNRAKYSALLKKSGREKLFFIEGSLRTKLEYTK